MRFVAALTSLAAVSATWTEICPASANCPTIMMGVSCENKDMCAITGGYSNSGFKVYYSKDQFATYTAADMVKDSVMLLDIALDSKGNGATAGIGILGTGTLYTSDVTDWNAGTDLDFLTMQDMNAFDNGEFGGVGSIGSDNGVIMSVDHGKDWVTKKWPASLTNKTAARYGAFPSPQVLYVSGGQWPSSKSNATLDTDCLRISKKLCIPSNNKAAIAATNKRLQQTDGYYAMMTKSTDGGNTWVSQFEKAGEFYFNDVHCADVDTCIAVGEGFTDGPAPGGYIYGTTDGGKNWNLLKKITNQGASLMRVHMISKTEAWVAGGDSGGGTFYHTTDGGKTFALDGKEAPFVGTVAGMHFVDNTLGFAVGITSLQIATMVKYTA